MAALMQWLFGEPEREVMEAMDRADKILRDTLLTKTVEHIWQDDRELIAAIRSAGSGSITAAVLRHAQKMIEEMRP